MVPLILGKPPYGQAIVGSLVPYHYSRSFLRLAFAALWTSVLMLVDGQREGVGFGSKG